MKTFTFYFLQFLFFLSLVITAKGQQTEILYLSGTGNDHTVDWQFFCTSGRNSGKWTTLPVPSNWELQGFGKYNYGHDKDTVRGKELGLYKYKFKVPSAWQGKAINIVFEGSMTDTEVKINGKLAGPIHQGSFYRFKYGVSKLLNYGKTNFLEVTVTKHSANESVNGAERRGDFWIFGGIFRPVYLEAFPKEHIKKLAINATADGDFLARLYLSDISSAGEIHAQIYTIDGQKAGTAFGKLYNAGDTIVDIRSKLESPLLWNPEFPNLYKVSVNLVSNNKVVHTIEQKFGFRTVELRVRDGIYVNGTKIKFKGVCRHSFWPNSGRTTSKSLSIKDVQLMKDMNMNAVRMSHYPPDEHFLDACDSIGLFVLDELAGWHKAYDTEVGTKLVKEMVERDVNHPSVVIWNNGNEGGHNFDLDPVFDAMDIQKRPVIHPWQVFRGISTEHYINYNYGNGTYFQGHDVFFPTEFLHGLFDGGLGAGLEDYWELMWRNPLNAGGFLWVFSDEGVVRTDKNGAIDTDGSHAPDGILGPYREKEGSFNTIKEVWAPIYFEHKEITPDFDGTFTIENRFFFTDIHQCKFSYLLKQLTDPFDQRLRNIYGEGKDFAAIIPPGQKGALKLSLPQDWMKYDVLEITAFDPSGRQINKWSWPISLPKRVAENIVQVNGPGKTQFEEKDSLFIASANGIRIFINRNTGLIQQIQNQAGIIPFNNGPILCEGENGFEKMTYKYEENKLVINYAFTKKSNYKALQWTMYPSGWIKLDVQYFPVEYESSFLGISFSYPEMNVKSIRWMGSGPYRVWKNRMKGTNLNVWEKEYNTTITGEHGWIYPEFKGYYSNLYWMKLITTEQPFTVVCANEDVFLRLFTPDSPKEAFNVVPTFPSGDISFMQGITPIGTKGQKPENMGPMGKKNMYFDYWKARPKEMTLWFDFSGK
jgi:hypothetical protein